MRLALVALVAVTIAGCGGGDTGAESPAPAAGQDTQEVAGYLETDIPKSIRDQNAGDDLRDVQCIHKQANTYDCSGYYQMGRESAEAFMGGIDTSNFAAGDWQAIIEQNSGRVSYDVTVAPDGTYNSSVK